MNLSAIAEALGPWLQLLSMFGAVVQCVGTIVLWMLVRKFMTRKECEDCRAECQKQVNARLGKQEASSGELHQAVAQAAPKDKLAEVDKADVALRGEIQTLTAMVEGLKEQQAAMIQGLKEQQGALARQVNLLMQHHLGGRRE